MKIVYSFNGSEKNDWTKTNIISALHQTGNQIVEKDWYELYKRHGRAQGTRLLVEAVLKEKPDIFFGYLSVEWIEPSVIRAIKEAGIISVNYFCDGSHLFDPCIKEFKDAFDYQIDTHLDGMWRYYELSKTTPLYLQQATVPENRDAGRQRDIEVGFVGQLYGVRRQWLQRISASGITVVHKYNVPETEMFETYRRSWIGLNISYNATTAETDIKQRDFEIPGCGALLFTHDQPEVRLYYDINREIVVYSNPEDLVSKLKFYLSRKDIIAQKAENGYQRVQREHTWKHRIDKMLSFIQKDRESKNFLRLALTHAQRRENEEAFKCYEAAYNTHPWTIDSALAFARALTQIKHYQAAEDILTRLLGEYHHLTEAVKALANVYFLEGKFSECEALLQNAIRKERKDDAYIRLLLAETYVAAGRFPQAREWYEQALLKAQDDSMAAKVMERYLPFLEKSGIIRPKHHEQEKNVMRISFFEKNGVKTQHLLDKAYDVNSSRLLANVKKALALKKQDAAECFDRVEIEECAEFLDKQTRCFVLSYASRRLKPGGLIEITIPDFSSCLSEGLFLNKQPGKENNGVFFHYSRLCGCIEFEAEMFEAGFEKIASVRIPRQNGIPMVSVRGCARLYDKAFPRIRAAIHCGTNALPSPADAVPFLDGASALSDLVSSKAAMDNNLEFKLVNNENWTDEQFHVSILTGNPVVSKKNAAGCYLYLVNDPAALYPSLMLKNFSGFATKNPDVKEALCVKGYYKVFDYSLCSDAARFTAGLRVFLDQIL